MLHHIRNTACSKTNNRRSAAQAFHYGVRQVILQRWYQKGICRCVAKGQLSIIADVTKKLVLNGNSGTSSVFRLPKTTSSTSSAFAPSLVFNNSRLSNK